MRFVSYGDRTAVSAGLRPVYTAPTSQAARQALDAFAATPMGVKYPQTAATWQRAWERFIPSPGSSRPCCAGLSTPGRDRVA